MISGTALFFGLFNNLAIFIILVSAYGALNSYFEEKGTYLRQVAMGLSFGLFAIGCMFVKIPVAEGVIVDQRNAIVALSGALGGPLAAPLCAAIAGVFRADIPVIVCTGHGAVMDAQKAETTGV
jgi:LytS/YehU family sensor histidine kinase